ncbi:MAG TPA: SIS domain-containing protein [Xanthobacteraceae bacterium]|nr:SIS domain-containing protein [Xanthobacteraceae bacterium]
MDEPAGGIASEFREVPDILLRQAKSASRPLAELVARLRHKPPQVVVTCARGSSAHAATFGKYLIERHVGVPVAAASPSIATVYRRPLQLRDQLFIAVSQSGRSDDLIEMTSAARAAGALTLAVVNDEHSPLAAASDIVLPMAAGPERSVAATKTFVSSLAALLRLAAAWADESDLAAAIERLPQRLAAAGDLDWRAALDALAHATSLVTIGRGPTLAIAREAALKLKETCDLHAEPFSSAEFRHGPIALVAPSYPILMFMPTDAAAAGMRALAADLQQKGARVFATGQPKDLPALPPDHPDTDAVCLIQSFYALLVDIAARRGIDADRPRHLQKVTRTR